MRSFTLIEDDGNQDDKYNWMRPEWFLIGNQWFRHCEELLRLSKPLFLYAA
jgi:hypothetical protein